MNYMNPLSERGICNKFIPSTSGGEFVIYSVLIGWSHIPTRCSGS